MITMASVLVGLYLATGLLPLVILGPVIRHREKPGATGLLIAVFGTVVWGLCNAAFLLAPTEQLAYILWNIRIAATGIAVVGWFLTVSEYVGLVSPSIMSVSGLLAIPATGQMFAWTNDMHNLHYTAGVAFESVESVVTSYGPVFYGNVLYLYALLAVGATLLLSDIFGRRRIHRLQSLALLCSVVPPLSLNIVHLGTLHQLDLTSVGFVVTVFVIGWALFYGQLLEVIPVARDQLVRDMSDPVVTLDTENRVVDSNHAARELCGVESEYTGMPGAEFLSRFPDLLDRLKESGDEEIEVTVTDDGNKRHFDLRCSTVRGPDGQRLGRLLVFREITERKRRAQQLEEKNRRLDEFTSFVSHDLRNPLQVASGRAQLIRDTGNVEHIEHVESSLSRMEEMISDLRTLTRADQESIDRTGVSLAVAAKDSWAQVETGSATLKVSEEYQLPADRELLLHVFENLFRNAVEHGSEDVTVRVGPLNAIQTATRADGSGVSHGFFVADDGPGIPPENREDILTHGYTTTEDGTGFGLSIVRTVADAHGWEITVTESESGGARFEFWEENR